MRLLLISLLLVGCNSPKTIVAPIITQKEASWVGRSQNSGIIDYIPEKGFLVEESTVARYKKLALAFNEEPVGISIEGNKTYLTEEGMVNFLNLNDKNINK